MMLNQVGQIVVNSTKIGYLRRISPNGQPWAPNSEFWALMKGHDTPLVGPAGKTIYGGWPKRAGYQFKKVNPRRMQNSLLKRVSIWEKKVEIEYEASVRERAIKTQRGGMGEVLIEKVESVTWGRAKTKEVALKFKIPPRPHLGIADKFPRMGSKTDPQHIEENIVRFVEKHI
jgi:hypothetical protein